MCGAGLRGGAGLHCGADEEPKHGIYRIYGSRTIQI